jgi:signal peptidase I
MTGRAETIAFPTALGSPAARARRTGWRAALGRGLRAGERLLAVVGALFITYHLAFSLSVIASGSMSPTLCGGGPAGRDWVLVERVSLLFRGPRRWEVVSFDDPMGVHMMKRVVGLPGETVSVSDGRLLVGGEPARRPESLGFLHYYDFGRLEGGRPAECGRGYFVLGDDSRDSYDCRYTRPLPRERIRGRAWLRVWPPSRIGFVGP